MADYFDNAAANDRQAKLDLLGQIAANGSQAAQGYQGATQQVSQAKSDALAQALGAAQKRGAPQAELDQISATVGHQYDNTLGSLSAQAANRASSFGQLSSAAGTYMDQAAAGIPALRNALAQKVATLQAQGRAQQGQQQFQLEQQRIAAQQQAEDRALSRELSMARLQNERASAAKPPGVDDIVRELGGQDMAGDMLLPKLADATDQANRAAFIGSPEDRFDPAERVGGMAGLPGSVVRSLAGGAQRRMNNDDYQAMQQQASSDDQQAYGRAASFAADMLGTNDRSYTRQHFAQDVTKLPGVTPAVAAKIISQYGSMFSDADAL